ncbi:MAG TPA: serine/threonine-protein kinase, partial [Ktedonobacteraceae bacterium]|nr:serine/threonine-protein kinase [Ktedonobacteraceae bacterium]
MPGMEQLISRTLGNYRIERLLGQSQLGAAYLAVEPERGIRAMVTTFQFPPEQTLQEREQFGARFASEGATLTGLAHANILPIYAFGVQPDYLYLITAFVKEASLGQTLKQNTRFTPQQTLHVLRQLAAGLDYAHSQGITHGMLSLANAVVNENLEVGIAGFGLRAMLEIHGNIQSARPLAHLSSTQGAFLGSPEYIAPERILGLACDTRVDIYALGVMVFALLSGVQPFRAATPLDIALQRLQQPTPLVHALCTDVPEAFDLVIGRALERDPGRRFQSANELALAFERVLKAQDAAQQVSPAPADQFSPDAQLTMPPTINWFDEQVTPSGSWQVAPQMGAASLRTLNNAPNLFPGLGALASSPNDTEILGMSNNMPAVFPGARNFAPSPYGTEIIDAPNSAPSTPQAPVGPRGTMPKAPGASLPGIDPFAWWSSHTNGRKQLPPPPPAQRVSLRRLALPGQTRPRPDQQGRRKVVTMAIAGVAAAGALTVGAITFSHLTQSIKQSPQPLANAPATT